MTPPRASRTAPDARRRRALAAAGIGAALLILIAIFAAVGGPHTAVQGLAAVLYVLVGAGAPAAAYLLGAIGLGRLGAPLLINSRDPWALQASLGLALMLSLSHLCGWLGLFGGPAGFVVAVAPVGIGLFLLARHALRELQKSEPRGALPSPALLALPALALLLVAASNPPGWLWNSEAGGYDALSYHLQLPQEWLALGRIAPLEHNFFSYLPSYAEAAFMHLGAMTGVPTAPDPQNRPVGLLAGEGMGVIAAQLLHAGMAVLAAVLVARLAMAAARASGQDERHARVGGAFAGALVLSTPWVVVTGSLAYNEMALAALFAGAMIAALDDGLRPAVRGVLAGSLIGVACGAKPTALFLAGPTAGVLLLGAAPRREWLRLVIPGAIAGVVALAPWLLRNAIASGNPVFPHLTDLFGAAHWTPEQVDRYKAAVSFDGTLIDRLRLLVLPGPAGPDRIAHRGLLHPQWLAFFPLALLAAVATLRARPTRRTAALLSIGSLLSLVAWLSVTHLQSRFLLPLVVPCGALIGLALAAASSGLAVPRRRPLAAVAAALPILLTAGGSILLFASQRGGRPNELLIPGPGIRTGEAFRPALVGSPPAERAQLLAAAGPEAFVNLTLPPGERLYLLGDATPLYYTVPTLYHTTWDASPLGRAMRKHPDAPAAWSAALLERGVGFVLYNPAELDRLHRSGRGWYDPLVTVEAATGWLQREGRLVRAWSESGPFLFDLRTGAPPR